jgi:hypothetical protein
MPTFTMTSHDNYKDDSFYTFYKKNICEWNEFVTIVLHLLSTNVPNVTESFLYTHSDGLQYFANQISYIIRN